MDRGVRQDRGLDVDVIVPGHGPIGGKKELAEMANYSEFWASSRKAL